ncbi:MAG: polysaccharide pyruvyl transferase family protein [Phycisphaerae bacterium]
MKHAFASALGWAVGLHARLSNALSKQERVLCLAPPVPANCGDEAMLWVVLNELRKRGRSVKVIQTGPQELSLPEVCPGAELVEGIHPYFTTTRSRKERLLLLRQFRHCRDLIVIGADVLDGTYSKDKAVQTFRCLQMAHSCGIHARVLGFSLSAEPSGPLAESIRSLPDSVRLMARDPLSAERLRSVAGPRVEQVADLAFLFEAAGQEQVPPEVRTFIEDCQGPLLGLSATPLLMDSRIDAQRRIARAMGMLARSTGGRILLVQHHPKDLETCSILQQAISQDAEGASMIVPFLPAAVAKTVIRHCNHVFSGRMHVAIAALSCRRPVTCFPYRGKFRGLMQMFEIDNSLLDVDDIPEDPERICELFAERVEQSDVEAARIQDHLPGVMAMARRNFDGL